MLRQLADSVTDDQLRARAERALAAIDQQAGRLTRWEIAGPYWVDGLKANGTRWDVIGMSMYPAVHNWKLLNEQALANMNDMVTRYDKEVMMVECGMPWDQPQGTRQFLTDLIQKVQSVEKGRGIGVFYWEPEAYGNWKGYTLGAFDNSGKPTVALDAFR
ncbi:MAG TPA: glycosyl hydrolase 53 family protein [Ginsengibacter sp.]|nr:glycosyl hydrolase 53 family protein [Ginsengibacter sp.]